MRLVCPLMIFSTLSTRLSHNLIKEKLRVPSKSSTKMKVHFILPLTIRRHVSFLQTMEDIHFGLVRMYELVCDAVLYLLDNIYIRFGNMLYRQIVGITMGTNCASLLADLFLFCYERDFFTSFY